MDNLIREGTGRKRVFYLIGMCIGGLTGSALFLLFGYWIAGAMALENKNAGTFISRFGSVLKEPFSNYYNKYTPIIMAIAVVVFEFIFFLLLVTIRRPDTRKKHILENEETNNMPEDILYQASEEETAGAEDAGSLSANSDNGMPLEEDGIPVEGQMFLSQEICLELMNNCYSMEQITAMAEIVGYMPDVSAELLIKMFDVSMSVGDIHEYISIFYG